MKNKKLVIIFLAGVLLLNLLFISCGNNESDNKQRSKTLADKMEENSKKGTNISQKEKLTWDTADLSWRKDTSPITLSCFIDFTWYPVDKWGADDVSKEITRRTGVSLDVTKASDSQQLQTMLAANELPDLVFGAGNVMKRFANSNVSYAFNDLMKEYCPEFLQILDPIEITNNTVDDGNFYSLKTHWKTVEEWNDPRDIPSVGDVATFIREDVYQKLGSPSLDTIEDFKNLLVEVKNKYPDMVPWLMRPQYGNSVMEWFGLVTTYPTTYNGEVIKGISNPNFVNYYKYMNGLFRDGIISQENFAYQYEQYKQIRNSGKVFAFTDDTLRGDEVNKFFDDNGIKGYFIPIMKPLKVEGEIKYHPVDRGIGWADCYITKQAKNPKRAILYLEFLKSPEGDRLTQWGIEGKHYTLDQNGMIVRPKGYENWDVKQTGIFPWYFEASGFGESLKYYSDKVNNPNYSQYVDLLLEIKKYYTRDPALYFCNPQPETEEYDINTELDSIIGNADIQIITAPDEAEAMKRYEKMIVDLKKTGIDKLEEYYNKSYKDARERYEKLTGKKYEELFK